MLRQDLLGAIRLLHPLPFQIGDLPFRVGDLLLGVGDLPVLFDYLLPEFLNLPLLLLDLPLEFLPAGRMRVRMPSRRCRLVVCATSGSRIHPPYGTRSRAKCPAEWVGILGELPQKQGREQLPLCS